MTPARIKAEELVERFIPYAHAHWDDQSGFHGAKKSAIESALIDVNNILSELQYFDSLYASERREFYTQVQTELKAMRDE